MGIAGVCCGVARGCELLRLTACGGQTDGESRVPLSLAGTRLAELGCGALALWGAGVLPAAVGAPCYSESRQGRNPDRSKGVKPNDRHRKTNAQNKRRAAQG